MSQKPLIIVDLDAHYTELSNSHQLLGGLGDFTAFNAGFDSNFLAQPAVGGGAGGIVVGGVAAGRTPQVNITLTKVIFG